MSNGSASRQIRKVAVLGAGTMGSRIAAQIANVGVPVVLLDMVPPGAASDASKAERNKFVLAALEGLKKSKPAAFYTPDAARLMTLGNFEDDLALVADCDWIIEVVAENLEIKRTLLDRVERHRLGGVNPDQQYEWDPDCEYRGGAFGGGAAAFLRDTFFQSAEVHAAARGDSDARDGCGGVVAVIGHFCDQRLGKAIVRMRTIRRTLSRTGSGPSRWVMRCS